MTNSSPALFDQPCCRSASTMELGCSSHKRSQEGSKIYAFTRTSPRRIGRDVGKRDTRADPQPGLALRPGGMVLRHLLAPWQGAGASAEDRRLGPHSTWRDGAGRGLRHWNAG